MVRQRVSVSRTFYDDSITAVVGRLNVSMSSGHRVVAVLLSFDDDCCPPNDGGLYLEASAWRFTDRF